MEGALGFDETSSSAAHMLIRNGGILKPHLPPYCVYKCYTRACAQKLIYKDVHHSAAPIQKIKNKLMSNGMEGIK